MGATTMAEVGIRTDARSRYYFQRELETMPREKLAALQLERLRATVTNAYEHVPMHRARLDAAGILPDDIASLADLERLPFTCKTDLRDHYPFGLFARPREKLARLHASSGTTGKPTVVGYTAADLDTWADLMARSLACGGTRPGDLVHNAYGYGLFTGGLGAHYGAERLGATVVPMSGGSTERQIALILDFGARVLCATPSYALAIAELAEKQGVDLTKSTLEVGLFGAEPWSDAMRREIEARLGLKAIDIYGLSEIMGPGVACECECQAGLHGWEDHFLFEVIDPETRPCGARGRGGRARDHHVDQGSAADAALPDPRHHQGHDRAVRLRADALAHPAHHGAQRRHADHPRRQRVSVAGGSGARSACPTSRRTTSSLSSAAAVLIT